MQVLTPSSPRFAQIAARITAPLSAPLSSAPATGQAQQSSTSIGNGRAGTLAGALVALRVEVYTAQAQTQVMRVQDEMLGTLVDLTA